MSMHIGKTLFRNSISEVYGNKSRVEPNNNCVFEDSVWNRDNYVEEKFDNHGFFAKEDSKMQVYREIEGRS